MKSRSPSVLLAFAVAAILLPVGVLLALLLPALNAPIDAAKKELAGNAYQRSLQRLLEGAERSRLVLATCQEGTDCSAQKNTADRIVDDAFQGLHRAKGAQDAEVAALTRKWSESRSDTDPSKQAQFITEIRAAIARAGDSSGLSVDPDLNAYYLADVILRALPLTQDYLGRALAQGHATQDPDLARVVAGTESALNASPAMRGRLVPPLVHFKNAAGTFLAVAKQPITQDELHSAGEEALKAGFNFGSVASLELDRLLEARVASSTAARIRSLSWVGLATAFATLLAVAGVWFFSRPTKQLRPGLSQLADVVNRYAELDRKTPAISMKTAILRGELNAQKEGMGEEMFALARKLNAANAESRRGARERTRSASTVR